MKTISSPVYTIRIFEDSKSEDFMHALDIYMNQMPSELRTSSNEIIHWIDNYNNSFDLLSVICYYSRKHISLITYYFQNFFHPTAIKNSYTISFSSRTDS